MTKLIAVLAAVLCLAAAAAKADPVMQSDTYACTREASWAANGTALAVSVAGKQIYVCGFAFIGGSAASTAQIGYATTATSCASLTAITPVMNAAIGTAVVDHQTYYAGLLPVPSGSDLCATTSGAAAALLVYYSQF